MGGRVTENSASERVSERRTFFKFEPREGICRGGGGGGNDQDVLDDIHFVDRKEEEKKKKKGETG